jgi:hypothetical protein
MSAEWEPIDMTKDNDIWSIDRTSIREYSDLPDWVPRTFTKPETKTTFQAWFQINHVLNKGEKARESKQQWAFDCLEGKLKLLYSIRYAPNGSIIYGGEARNSIFRTVVPDTIGEMLFLSVCKPNLKRPNPPLNGPMDNAM